MQEHILKTTSDKRIIGIGSGSTVTSIIKFLPRENKKYAASSITTSVLLTESGFDVIPLHSVSHLDVYIDGTDFYDSSNNLLKGGGGCILNERICMYMSKETHIIAQKTKFKKDFTGCTVVFEVMEHCIGVFNAFCVSKNIKAIMRHNFSRFGLYTTENGNYLFDVDYNDFLENDFCCIPGVFCHGFFNRNDYKYKIYEIDL